MSRWTLVAFYVLATLHVPIGHFIGFPVHWVAWVLCMVVATMESDFGRAQSNIFFVAYLILLALAGAWSLLLIEPQNVILGSLSYLLMPLIFVIALQRNAESKILTIAKVNTVVALLAGLAGIYQLFVDPVLFGIYAGTMYEALEGWAIPRASSLFGSPQVFSAYMVFSVVLYDAFQSRGRLVDWAAIVMLTAMSLLSGSVACVAGIGTYFAVRTFMANRTLFVVACFAAAIFVGTLYLSFDLIESWGTRSPLYRIASIVNGGLGNAERIDTWLLVLGATPPLTGNGIGSASTLVAGASRFNTESYLLNIYYEGGIILLAAFAVLIAKLATSNVPQLRAQKFGFLAAFVLTSIVVHAFYAWALPVVWILFFGFIAVEQKPIRTVARNLAEPALAR